MKAFAGWVRGMPVLDRWVSTGAFSAGVAGGMVALVIGLFVHVPTAPVGTLKVTVVVAGGPLTVAQGAGQGARAAANAEVTVTAGSTSVSSRTDSAGVATFLLPGGSYLVSALGMTCGTGIGGEATVTALHVTSLTCVDSVL